MVSCNIFCFIFRPLIFHKSLSWQALCQAGSQDVTLDIGLWEGAILPIKTIDKLKRLFYNCV
jgi:hypothetical protein